MYFLSPLRTPVSPCTSTLSVWTLLWLWLLRPSQASAFHTLTHTHLLNVLLLHLLEMGPQVQGLLGPGPQQSLHHGICRDPYSSQGGPLKLATQVIDFLGQICDLGTTTWGPRGDPLTSAFFPSLPTYISPLSLSCHQYLSSCLSSSSGSRLKPPTAGRCYRL